VKANSTLSVDLVAELNGTDAGAEHKFTSTLINSSALTVNGSMVTPTLRTSDYQAANVTVTSLGGGLTHKAGDLNAELGQFRITNNSTRGVTFKAITLRNNGNGDLTSIKNAYVERNGLKVSSVVTNNGKDLTFAIDNNLLTDSQTATYYIRGTVDYVDNASGDTYNFVMRNTSDLSAVETNNSAIRVQVTGAPVTLASYLVNGGDLKFTKDASFVVTATYSAGTPSVVFMSGTITAKEAITLEDATLTYSAAGAIGVQQIAKRFYLTIGGSTFSWTPSSTSPAAGSAMFDGAVTVNGTVPVKLWADVDVNAPA